MRSALSNPLRDAWVEINLDLFEENLREIKRRGINIYIQDVPGNIKEQIE